MDFIEHQQRCPRVPALVQDQRPVGGHVAVQVLPALQGDQMATERGFADLSGTRQEHHFLGQIGLHAVIEVALHGAALRLSCNGFQDSRDFLSDNGIKVVIQDQGVALPRKAVGVVGPVGFSDPHQTT